MARCDADKRSDLDPVVALPAGKRGLAPGALMHVQELPGRRADAMTDCSLHPAFRNRVLREAQVLKLNPQTDLLLAGAGFPQTCQVDGLPG